ncbi:MAG: ribosome recycling factor [Anaerolineaceae bacterium]|nr:ribosome recycling factor [Anaerolineaceae bacterium]
MINDILSDAEVRMKGALEALEEDLKHIRTGRATPALVDAIEVEYYGMPTRMNQLATITVPEPRQIMIRPFDASTINEIIKSIQKSDLGITPNTDGKVVRLNLPMLTEERRRELTKLVSKRVEEGHIAVRNVRRDLMKDLKEFEKEKMITEDDRKRGEDKLQEVTDKYVALLNEAGKAKEEEIMEV